MTRIIDDDEAEIEAEIQKELDAISAENLEIEDVEEDLSSFDDKYEDGTDFPQSLEEYLKFVQLRTEGVEQEVNDCDGLLRERPVDDNKNDDEILAQKIKEALGEDCHGNPLDLRNKVLSEIEDAEQKEQQQKLRRASCHANMALDVIRPDISDQVRLLEETAEKQLLELEEKQSRENEERIEMYGRMKREETERLEKERNARKERRDELEAAQKLLNENQKMLQEKIENENKQEEHKLNILQQKFQKEIKELEEENKKEKKALEEMQLREAEYQRVKHTEAAVRIQKTYRGHRVYIKHKDILEQRRKERMQIYEEKLEKEYQEKMKRKEDEVERKRVEEERIRKEEQWKKEMEEKKRKEDERTKQEEKKQEEQRRELEERKGREEERRKDEEQRLKEMEEERKKNEEIEKKKEEEEKKRNEKQKREEERMKNEQEDRRRKEEERKKEMEEIERKKTEEQQRKMEEDKQAEAKRKEMEEIERKRKENEEKMRMEEEKKKQEEQKIYEEMINKQKQRILDEEKRKCEEVKKDEVQPCSKYLVNLEERRMKWLKEHVPWSSTTYEDREQPVAKTKARQRPRRPFSASRNLPSLTKEQLLQASPPGTSLHQVVKVCVCSCPTCNMNGLDCCPSLKILTMKDCGLLAVEELGECKELQELRLQDNRIEYINVKDMHKLDELLLSNNNLTSVQGLGICPRLTHLDLTNNRITRIGDLSTCPNLQKLSLDNNQLIMTKGLSSLSRLQYLSCTNNHLPNVKEIDSCQFLQILNLTGNNLQKPPLLTNHVLLRELRLDDNSISTLEPLASVWLPSLHLLSVSQNSLSNIDSLDGLVMLQYLDISHNLISDIDSLIPGVSGCRELQTLKITGNPVNEEPQCRKAITDTLSSITQLDDESLQPNSPPSATISSPFIALCHRQQQECSNIVSRHRDQLTSINKDTMDPNQVIHQLNIKTKQFDELHQQAVVHLLQHEQFEVDVVEETKNCELAKEDGESHTLKKDERIELTKHQDTVDTKPVLIEKQKEKLHIEEVSSHRETRSITDEIKRNDAAVKIQSLWRGWHIRHLIDVQMKRWLGAVTIQATWRGYSVRSRRNKQRSRVSRARKALWEARHDAAATTIQACYRGYRVRRRLAQALESLKYDNSDDDEFNYDEEVDLSAFDFDSGVLDDGWTPTDTPQLPSRGPALPKTGQTVVPSKPNSYQPRQAWRSADSPMEADPITNQRRVPGINLQQSPEQDLMSVTSGTQSHMTHRAGEMSNEWGLKNTSTAELMWKRANRMKYNPARKRKLLDPAKRLALFKKLDEANKLREVKPPPKRQPQRLDYFATREANMLPSESSTPTSEREVKAQMTYSWVHSQGVVHEDQQENYMGFTQDYTTPTNKKPSRKTSPQSKSSVSLPQLDAVHLTGRNVPLVSSPALIREQMSKDSTPRRNSSVSQARSTAVSGSSGRSNEKSNSAGARMTNEKRERR